MILSGIPELTLFGVYDRGVPNQERIAIAVNTYVEMGQFGILLGVAQQDGQAVPIRDNFLWFGTGTVARGDWIFIYSGPGEPRVSEVPNTTNKIYTIHWGRSATILGEPTITPILFRVGALNVYAATPALPSPSA